MIITKVGHAKHAIVICTTGTVRLAMAGATPYVLFADPSQSNKFSIMKYDGFNWAYYGPPGFTSGTGSLATLKAYDGSLFVTYASSSSNGTISVKQLPASAGEWIDLGPVTADLATNFLTMDIFGGKMYLAFQDSSCAGGAKGSVMVLR